jgi:hypothetical protein
MAIIVAVLYLGMIELMMLDASRELAAARRFRARVVALTLAENGAELAALRMTDPTHVPKPASHEDELGTISGSLTKGVADLNGRIPFVVVGTAESAGLESTSARVRLQGYILGSSIQIEYAQHSQ